MLWVVACSCHLCPTADDSDYHGGSDVAAAIQLDRQCGIHPLPRIYIHRSRYSHARTLVFTIYTRDRSAAEMCASITTSTAFVRSVPERNKSTASNADKSRATNCLIVRELMPMRYTDTR